MPVLPAVAQAVEAYVKGGGKAKPPAAPSLPPGDPGLDAPSVPDPGTASAEPHGHEGHARRTVPREAMLTAGSSIP